MNFSYRALVQLSLFLFSSSVMAAGVDSRTGVVNPNTKQVVCVGTAFDNSVIILSYKRDDHNLFVPGAFYQWPSYWQGPSSVYNVTFQKSAPLMAAPGPMLPVNLFILQNATVKGVLILDKGFFPPPVAYLTIVLNGVSLQLVRSENGSVSARLFRHAPYEELAQMTCK